MHPPNNLTTTAPNGSSAYSDRQQAAILVNKIFHTLTAIFPAWASAIRDQNYLNQAKTEWLKGLIENKITADYQIEAGFKKARAHNSPFLPSIGQFIEWCKSSQIQKYPSFETAYAEIIQYIARSKHERSQFDLSDFVHHTIIHNMDFYNFQNLPVEKLSQEFRIAYRATEIEIQNGKPLRIPVMPSMIEEEKKQPATKERADESLKKLNSLFED